MKLSLEYIESQVLSTDYAYDGTFTVCTITTHHGSKHVGTSGCLDPANYDRTLGEQLARKNAVDELWALEGYFFGKLGLSLAPGTMHAGMGVQVHISTSAQEAKFGQYLRQVMVYATPVNVENKEVPTININILVRRKSDLE